MHLEFITRLRVEPRLGKQAVDVGVDVHDQHRAALAREDVQVIEVELPGLAGERGVEVMRHAKFLLAGVYRRGRDGPVRANGTARLPPSAFQTEPDVAVRPGDTPTSPAPSTIPPMTATGESARGPHDS